VGSPPPAASTKETVIARSAHSFERYKRERRKQLKRKEKLERRQERIASKKNPKDGDQEEGAPSSEDDDVDTDNPERTDDE
jgi:hypothetical protein